MTRTGDLRNHIEHQTRSLARDTTTGADETFTKVADDWAAISTLSGTRRIDGQNAGGGATHQFTIHHRTDIDADGFVLFDGRRFSIQDIEQIDERGIFMNLLCEEMRKKK